MNPILVLNIGTARSRDLVLANPWRGAVRPDTKLLAGQSRHAVTLCGLRVLAYEFRRVDGPENTHIFIVTGSGDVMYKVRMASAVLHQDCIAVYNVQTTEGSLVGPNAEAWGEFNSGYFQQPSIHTASHALLLAALYRLRPTPAADLPDDEGICEQVYRTVDAHVSFEFLPARHPYALVKTVFERLGLDRLFPVVAYHPPGNFSAGVAEWLSYVGHRWDRNHPYGRARWKLVDNLIEYLETNKPEVEE